MIYLVYNTQEEAQQALSQIWKNMQPIQDVNAGSGINSTKITTCWDVERQRIDGKYVFQKPTEDNLQGVFNYLEEEFNINWFN